jgi:BirA family transcriptional regulator, biotin operon repressor / biotin---[acetyl-CoA-carboxylase] ligase
LLGVTDSLSPDVVVPLLRGRFGHPYTFLEWCDSTQLQIPATEPEGAVVATNEQKAGRGRLGRAWIAVPGTSLLFSINLRPRVPDHQLPQLTILAGSTTAAAIQEVTRVQTETKFPNDLLVNGRKLAGILAEAREDRVVLGIGINVNASRQDLPTDLETEPTSLMVELGRPVARAELLAAILFRLERRYDAWVSEASGA